MDEEKQERAMKIKHKLRKFFSTHWLVFLFILVFFLRLPSLFEPFTYGDEGIYLTLGQAIRRGLVLYRDIHDNKPPLLYLLAALAGDFSTYRLILLFWSFTSIFVFYELSQLLFSKNKSAIIFSTTSFAILSSIHTFEGNIGNAENFMLLPTIVAFYLVLTKSITKIWAGVLFGLATLFKVPAAFDFIAALAFIFLLDLESRRLLITNCFLLFFGFVLPILFSFIYYAFQGALGQYLSAAFFQNIPYLASWTADKPQVGGLPLPLLSRGFLVLALVLFLFVFRKKISLSGKLILAWFGFSWFAALLSSRPYPHYLIQVLPSLSLALGLIFQNSRERVIPLFLVFIFGFSFFIFHFWSYPNLSYYLNFYAYALGQKNKEEYFEYFDQAKEIYALASYLKKHTLPEERIFIWGTVPSVYALSKRLPVGRYTTSYHIIDFNGYEETIARLKMKRPRYIVLIASETRPFAQLSAFVGQNYALEKTIGEAQIYHRVFQ